MREILDYSEDLAMGHSNTRTIQIKEYKLPASEDSDTRLLVWYLDPTSKLV